MHPDLPLDQILIGDCRELLKTLPDESVNCVVTSPPYWGLRSYGTDPQIWQNGHEPCIEHQWGDGESSGWRQRTEAAAKHASTSIISNHTKIGQAGIAKQSAGNTCSICGAWRGELGLEPTPELYVAHLTQIFREVRRVLRDDGTIWVNLGDSYASTKVGNTNEAPDKKPRPYFENGTHLMDFKKQLPPGLKPKDLVGIPWMVAFALRADGWYLRSDIIWAKPNPMPESVTDRPTKSHEYIFLLSKSQKYYYDADAVREPHQDRAGIERFSGKAGISDDQYEGRKWADRSDGLSRPPMTMKNREYNPNGRNRRTVWTVPTAPFKGAHFATFPPKLIEPCILAGCPVDGVVLDPFMGSGTTASVCISLKRHYIGFDLNPAYVEGIAQDRADTTPPPLFIM